MRNTTAKFPRKLITQFVRYAATKINYMFITLMAVHSLLVLFGN
jgi:hypothetical protein